MRQKFKAVRSIMPDEVEELRNKGLIVKTINPVLQNNQEKKKELKEVCRKNKISKIAYLRLKEAYNKSGIDGVYNILRRRGYKRKEWDEIGKLFKN